MPNFPEWLLEWAFEKRRKREHPQETQWLRLLDDLHQVKVLLAPPFQNMTLQELLALVYFQDVREGFSINPFKGGLRPAITLSPILQQISMKQFLPDLIDILKPERVRSFEAFIEPLVGFLRIPNSQMAMTHLFQLKAAQDQKNFDLPLGAPTSRRQLLVSPDRIRIRPGQFGTSGQSRRAYQLDMLALRAPEIEAGFEDMGLTPDQIAEAQRRVKIFEDARAYKSRFETQVETAFPRDLAKEEERKANVMETLSPLFERRVANPQVLDAVIRGLLNSPENIFSPREVQTIANMFARTCIDSRRADDCMRRLRQELCKRFTPEFIDRIAALGFLIDPCDGSRSHATAASARVESGASTKRQKTKQ